MLGLGTDTGDTTPSVLLFFDQERCAAARLSTAHGHSRSPASQSLWLQRTAAPQLPVQWLASSKRLRLQHTAAPQVPVQRLASATEPVAAARRLRAGTCSTPARASSATRTSTASSSTS